MRAIIVGAGIGGITAAVALRRVGVEAVVFERARELREIGAGISVWTNAMRALEEIGLAEAVRAAGREEIGGTVRTAEGRTITSIPARVLEERFGKNVILTRPDLQTTLLAPLPDAALKLGAELRGFRQDGRGIVARFADGREERGDLLVGADGLGSAVRGQIFGEGKPRYAGFTAWRGLVELGEEHDGFEAWGRGELFGLVGLGRGRFYWYATKNAPEGQGDEARGRKAELLERFGNWHEPVPAVIQATQEARILRNDVYDRRPLGRRWGRGLVTLLGDAAHPMTPNLGQGACQAIEDAVELAECVRGRRDSIEAALSLYGERRARRAALVARRSRALARAVQLENPLLCRLRNAVVGALPLQMKLRQLDPVLRYGA